MGENKTTQGARESLREAFENHHAALVRMCVLVTGEQDIAEELVQDTFVRAASAIDRLPSDEFLPYLRATALNLWRNRLRRREIERRVHPRRNEGGKDLPFEDRDAVWQAVRRLPLRQRACVVLRYYEHLSEAETARTLGCAVGTVKSQTSRALNRLRKELDDAD